MGAHEIVSKCKIHLRNLEDRARTHNGVLTARLSIALKRPASPPPLMTGRCLRPPGSIEATDDGSADCIDSTSDRSAAHSSDRQQHARVQSVPGSAHAPCIANKKATLSGGF